MRVQATKPGRWCDTCDATVTAVVVMREDHAEAPKFCAVCLEKAASMLREHHTREARDNKRGGA